MGSKHKCLITIIGDMDTQDTIDLRVEWFPNLDIKDNSKNHKAITEFVFRLLELTKQNRKIRELEEC